MHENRGVPRVYKSITIRNTLAENLEIIRTTESALLVAVGFGPVLNSWRKPIYNAIIQRWASSEDALDHLAVGLAYAALGAGLRKQSIFHFEAYLRNPVPIPTYSDRWQGDSTAPLVSKWYLYSKLARLYELEHKYAKALIYLNMLPSCDGYTNPSDYTRVGDVLTKISVDYAVLYYEYLIKRDVIPQFRRTVLIKYKEAKDKQARGYVFIPKTCTIKNPFP